jgi:hypothetical protein
MEVKNNMDNNQQTPDQAAAKPEVSAATAPDHYASQSVTNLGVNEAKPMQGASVQSPLSGADVSMTTGAAFGGPIVSTEQGSVNNATRPTAN